MTNDALRDRLSRRLDERALLDLRHAAYAAGQVPLEFVAPEIAKNAEGRLQTLSVPWARLVISSIEERLSVAGFRTERQAPANDDLWSLWRRLGLDALAPHVQAEALTYGRGYVLVWADDNGKPTATAESARQCAVLRDPATRRVVAGMKRWTSEGRGHCVVFTPTEVRRYTSNAAVIDEGQDSPIGLDAVTWTDAPVIVPNPLGVVPLVALVNRPSLANPDGESELADLLPLLDSLAKLSTDLMVSSEFLAAPRRWATGMTLEEERDDDTDLPNGDVGEGNSFSDLPGRLWMAEDPQARFGQFDASDLTPFTNALAMLKRDLSSVAGLPPHYMGAVGDQPSSADAIRSAEASLVATCRRKTETFAGSWAEVMRLASAIELGRYDASLDSLETLWRNVETRTEAQSMDAASKGVSTGILDPDFAAEKYLDLTPTEVTRNSEARRRRMIETAASKALGS